MLGTAILIGCGYLLSNDAPREIIAEIGKSLYGAAAQKVCEAFGNRLTPEANHDLRKALVDSFAKVKREGEKLPGLEGAIYQFFPKAESLIPKEQGKGWDAWVLAVVVGTPEAIRDLICAGRATPDSPAALTVHERIGREFRDAFAELSKTAQHDKGFKAFLRESLWLLQQRDVQGGLPPEVVEKILSIREVPNLTDALEEIKSIASDTLEIVKRLEAAQKTVEELSLEYQERLREKDAVIAAKDEVIEALKLANDPTVRAALTDRLDYLTRRESELTTEVERLMRERDTAVQRLAELEPDEVRKRALSQEADDDPEAAHSTYEAKKQESRVTEVVMGCDQVELWVRRGDLLRAQPIWLDVMDGRPEVAAERAAAAALAFSFAANRLGLYAVGVPVAERAYRFATERLGPEHPYTLSSANDLASLYVSQGSYAEAEPLQEETLETSRRVLGPDHPHTLRNSNNLAHLYVSQGRYTEAEPLHAETLAARRRVLGPEHPETLTSANNLASLYERQGCYQQAEPLHAETLAARRRVLGPEHPDALVSANNLAHLHVRQERYADAEPLYVETLAARRRVLGPEHPDTLGSVNNLARLYERQERYAEAEPLYVETLAVRRRVLGTEHPDTLGSANNLAHLYMSQGRKAEAVDLLRPLLATARRLPGKHEVRVAIESVWSCLNQENQ